MPLKSDGANSDVRRHRTRRGAGRMLCHERQRGAKLALRGEATHQREGQPIARRLEVATLAPVAVARAIRWRREFASAPRTTPRAGMFFARW